MRDANIAVISTNKDIYSQKILLSIYFEQVVQNLHHVLLKEWLF